MKALLLPLSGGLSPRRHRSRRLHMDMPLLLALLTVAGTGLLILYSAGGQNATLMIKQSIHLLIGLAALVVLAQISIHHIRWWTPWLFTAVVVMLVLVLFIGVAGKGAQRWLDLIVIRFQPSEVMKISLPMMIAWYLSTKPLPLQWRHLLVCTAIMVVPVALILQQPDLGTALLVAVAGGFVLFLAGLSWWIIAAIAALIALLAPLFWLFMMHPYQRQRVLTFFDPSNDPLGTGWNIIQSKIAIGSGGVFGKGWLNGTQSQLDFLPEGSTDFIFAVFAEEFGLSGLCALIAAYGFIIVRSLMLASQGDDTFSRLTAGSLALVFFTYVGINIGMVCGLLPVVGLPLPLMSYGGTSIVTIMAGFGILISASAQRRLIAN